MNHEYSTWTLFILLAVVFIGAIVNSIDSEDVDVLCDIDGDMLIRINNSWVCTSSVDLEEDLRFPTEIIGVRGVSNTPEYSSFVGNTEVLAFDKNTMEQAFISIQVPHAMANGTSLYPHFHWTPSDTDTGDVVWCIEYTCADLNVEFPTEQFGCVVNTASGTANTHQITEEMEIGNGLKFSAMCVMRIYRNATDTRDTYDADANLLEFDIHYYIESLGEVI